MPDRSEKSRAAVRESLIIECQLAKMIIDRANFHEGFLSRFDILNEAAYSPPVSRVDSRFGITDVARRGEARRGERGRGDTFCRSIDISAGLYKVISLSGNATLEIQAYSI